METAKKYAIGILLLGFIAALWGIYNYPKYIPSYLVAGTTFLLLILVTTPTIMNFLKPANGTAVDFFQLSLNNFKLQLLVGALLFGGFVALNILANLTIGRPEAFGATILAPIFEEPFFRMVIPAILSAIGFNLFIVVLLSAALFMSFHWAAYGATMLATGAFAGAFIFAIIALLSFIFIKYNGQRSIVPLIIFHSLTNLYLQFGVNIFA